MGSDQEPVTAVNQTQTSLPRITGWFGLRCAVVLISQTLVTGCQGRTSTEPPSGVVELTDANFHHEVMDSKQPVLVEFWAPWCQPCLEMKPVLEDLAAEYHGRIRVGTLNIDDHPNIADAFDVKAPPVIILFQHGNVAKKRSGLLSKAELELMFSASTPLSEVNP